jgi:nucleosome binding factor SPN SPT16 subunit
MFTGCHAKSNVNIYPSQSSLVSLHEPPFFVFDIKDIELCHFERVNMGIKNFDFVLVYRDFANFKRISSVPIEQLDTLKDWFDEYDVLFSEGPMSLNWQNLLTQIRNDIGSFIEQGGWSFLQDFGNEDAQSQ